MASLPVLPSFAGTRRASTAAPTSTAARADTKLNLARRLRAEDRARQTTSVAPPSA